MPDLLISVRSFVEYQTVAAEAVEMIDFKEPRNGPLSPVDPSLWHRAAAWKRNPTNIPSVSATLSAALGESNDYRSVVDKLPKEFEFAKVGPSGIESRDRLEQLWEAVRRRLMATTELVAVAYADHSAAQCLKPIEIFELARHLGFRRCLLDTFSKTGKTTFDHLSIQEILELQRLSCESGMKWGLAGSLTWKLAQQACREGIHPDCYALRGDVCSVGRTSDLSIERIRAWVSKVGWGKSPQATQTPQLPLR